MARDCVKNTANYLTVGVNVLNPLLSTAAVVSASAWINADTFNSGANDNCILLIPIATGSSGIRLMIAGAAGAEKVRGAGRSQTTDALQAVSGATTVTTGVWHHVGAVWDVAGNTIRVYLDGSQDASSAVTFGATSYTPGTPTDNDHLGAGVDPISTVEQFDGRLAEVALWNGNVTTAEFAILANGYSPLFVLPSALLCYWPLIGDFSPELDYRRAKNATITGTVAAAAHPRVFYPAPPLLGRQRDAAATNNPVRRPKMFLSEPAFEYSW